MQEILFYRAGDLSSYLDARRAELQEEFEAMEANYIVNVDEDELHQYFVDKYALEAPVLCIDDIYVAHHGETDIDISRDHSRVVYDRSQPFYLRGTSVTIAVPFNGDPHLLQFKPSKFSLNPPRGDVVNQEVHLVYERVDVDTDELKRTYSEVIDSIAKHLEWVIADVEQFNLSLDAFVQRIISQRKERLLKAEHSIRGLDIPIKRRKDAMLTCPTLGIRKKPRIARPDPRSTTYKPEPALPTDEYENILHIIRNMVIVMERSPRAFTNMREEDLRQHFLVQLNGQYEGQATGETFNYEGKTDILIRYEGKNVFIAECKFWKGKKSLLESIDQLLGYTSWRDTKTALLVFYRRKDFSGILEKIPDIVKSHQCYMRYIGAQDETTFRYVFHHRDDDARELVLTVMVFNIPQLEE